MAVQRMIRCPMTDTERLATGRELAEQEVAWKAAEDERTAERARLNENVRLHRDRVRELAKALMDGHVDRLVDCEWTVDIVEGMRRLVRLDTREVVQSKLLTPEERKLAIMQDGMQLLIREVERGDPGPEADPEAVQLEGTDSQPATFVDPDQQDLPLDRPAPDMDDADADGGA